MAIAFSLIYLFLPANTVDSLFSAQLNTIGEINELGIYAFGNSQFEVLREINKDVTELFEELFNISENQLGKLPRKWKETLLEYVEKEDE